MAGSGRDTGLQVVHYVSALVTRNTPKITEGVRVGDLPDGAILIGARAVCSQGWGGGRDLILSLRRDGLPEADIATLSVNVAKVVDNPVSDILDALALGREVFVRLDSAPTANGVALVILMFIPKVG